VAVLIEGVPIPKEPKPQKDKEVDDKLIEQALFATITVKDEQRPWSVEELKRSIGDDPLGVEDAIARFASEGVIHRLGDFVWATRAAMTADEVSA
jgi:hypothetical protein